MKNLTLNQVLAAHDAGLYDYSCVDNDTVLIVRGKDGQYYYYAKQSGKYAYVMAYKDNLYRIKA